MRIEKTYETKAVVGLPSLNVTTKDLGQVVAYVACFGNVDLQNDRIMPGAFDNSLAKWRASGDPVPVIFAHDWDDLDSYVGTADPYMMSVDEHGLRVVMQMDPTSQAFQLIKNRIVKQWSFAYDVLQQQTASDGANELLELAIIECGPCLMGANPLTETVSVKSSGGDSRRLPSAASPEIKQLNEQIRALTSGVDRGNTLPAVPPEHLAAFKAELDAYAISERESRARAHTARARLKQFNADNAGEEGPQVHIDSRYRVTFDEADDTVRAQTERENIERANSKAETFTVEVFTRSAPPTPPPEDVGEGPVFTWDTPLRSQP